jgi:hypothetical protein
LPPRSSVHRSVPALIAATLLAALGFGTPASFAAQAEYASPSTTPFAASSPAPAAAPADHGGPRWAELSASQRKVLAPLSNDWNDGIDSRSKERWLDVAGRFPKMPPDEQQRANQRMVEWSHMTVAQRVRARENFQESRSVSKEEREARWKAYQALPDDKKRELAKRAAAAAAPSSAASIGAVAVRRRQPPPVTAIQPKTTVGGGTAAASHAPAGSAPVAALAHPGATTPLINHRAVPPGHPHDGPPKVAVGPNSVDRTTLLPKRPVPPTAGATASTIPPAHP